MRNVGSEMSCLLTFRLTESFIVLAVVLPNAGDCDSEGRLQRPLLRVGKLSVDAAAGANDGIDALMGSPRGDIGEGSPESDS
jgi:hypothetical protein